MDEATLIDGGPSRVAVSHNLAFVSTTTNSQFPIMDDGAAAVVEGVAPQYTVVNVTMAYDQYETAAKPAALDRHWDHSWHVSASSSCQKIPKQY